MNTLFANSSWLENALEDGGEAQTLVRLALSVGQTVLTRNFSRRAGAESDAINVPLLPLALRIADLWWPLLYEPIRVSSLSGFAARHRLDGAMHGYAFPTLAVCSAGKESLILQWGQESNAHQTIEFLTPPSSDTLERTETETMLMNLVETTLDRLSNNSRGYDALAASWNRVLETMSDDNELRYCQVAGQLGLDPYDDSSPDLSQLAHDLDPALFEDISEAAFVEELTVATNWTRHVRERLSTAPLVDVAHFGKPVPDDLRNPSWRTGVMAAEKLRSTLNFGTANPRSELELAMGEALLASKKIEEDGPPSINALIRREGDGVRIGTVARSAREQRFKACTGAYLGWVSQADEERAATPAFTRRQQAARAFAAEMLAPRSHLCELATPHGFTRDQIEEIAGKLVCPHETVAWQAYHAGIPFRGEDASPLPHSLL